MTIFARMPARAAGHSRRIVSILIAALTASVLAAILAAPAGAVVTEVEGTQVGVQPRSTTLVEPSGGVSNQNGNAVVGGANLYLVYWDPGAWFHHEWITNMDEFFERLGGGSGEFGSIFSALGQYRDRANTQAAYHYSFRGSYHDFAPYPATKCSDPEAMIENELGCVTDAQIRTQLQSFIAARGTPKGMNAIYYVMTPPGLAVCLTEASTHCSDYALTAEERTKHEHKSASYKNSFCSYHGDINPNNAAEGDSSTILYAVVPWSAGYESSNGVKFFTPGASNSGQAFDCQDGAFNPEAHGESPEHAKSRSTAEEEAFTKASTEEKAEIEKKRALEAGHIEEPNQAGRGEEGDYAQALTDVLINQVAVEQANIVTDPLLTSWQNTSTGNEATDECRNVFASTASPSQISGSASPELSTEAGTLSNESIAGGQYYINNVVNSGALHGTGGSCVGGVGLVARFTSPNPLNSGEPVLFDGMESTVSEFKGVTFGASGPPTKTYATFSWNFGDGTTAVTGFAPGAPTCEAPWLSPCAGSAFHTYTYGGTYNVTLAITDVAGNQTSVTQQVTVSGPAVPGASSGPPASTTSAATTTSGPTPAAGSTKSSPPPAARAAVASHSLRKALHSGVAITYAVNERVAGHFDVMIARSLANKLGVAGTPASGLPAGTPAQLVIAKAVLVTTKAGGSTIHIKFSKKVAGKLKHAKSVPLLLRLIVRNGESPLATVLSSVTLTG